MASSVDPAAENTTFAVVVEAFVILVALAWFPLPGVAIAIAGYGAALISGHLYRLWRTSESRRHRLFAMLGLVITWAIVLLYAGAALPSNLSVVVI